MSWTPAPHPALPALLANVPFTWPHSVLLTGERQAHVTDEETVTRFKASKQLASGRLSVQAPAHPVSALLSLDRDQQRLYTC